jgi:hypothetical protein
MTLKPTSIYTAATLAVTTIIRPYPIVPPVPPKPAPDPTDEEPQHGDS